MYCRGGVGKTCELRCTKLFFFNLQLASLKKKNHKDSTEDRMSDMSIVKLKRVCYIFSITLIVQVHSSALVY